MKYRPRKRSSMKFISDHDLPLRFYRRRKEPIVSGAASSKSDTAKARHTPIAAATKSRPPSDRGDYQRGSRRCRGGPPNPRPAPCAFGRASLTLIWRPPKLVPFKAAIARSASAASVISTKAKPRARPVSRSVTRLTRSTFPYGSKSARREDSVAPKSKFPTKMFFMLLTLVFQWCGRDEADLDSAKLLQDVQKLRLSVPRQRQVSASVPLGRKSYGSTPVLNATKSIDAAKTSTTAHTHQPKN